MEIQKMQGFIEAQQRYWSLLKEYDVVLEPQLPASYNTVAKQDNWANTYLESLKYGQKLKGLFKRKVAVIIHDTAGKFTHTNLQKAAWNSLGYNVTQDPSQDRHGHGSHCAGIYGAIHPELRLGICKEMVEDGYLKLIPAKCLNDQGAGSWITIERSIEQGEKIAEQLRAEGWFVIHSLSLGGGGYHSGIAKMIEKAIKAGSLFVVASGNTGRVGLQFPAKVPGVLAFGSHDPQGNRSRFSTYEKGLFAAAPGQDIVSTIGKDELVSWSGTSMATPAGGAVIAILASIYPQLNSTQAIKSFVSRFITDLMQKGKDPLTGYGSPKLGPYLGQQIEEPKDKEPEPPQEDRKAKARLVKLIHPTFRFRFDRGKINQETFYMKGSMEVQVHTDEFLENIGPKVEGALDHYFKHSGILISEKMDVEDAAMGLAFFSERYCQVHRGIKVEINKVLVEKVLDTAFIYEPSRHWKPRSLAAQEVQGIQEFLV